MEPNTEGEFLDFKDVKEEDQIHIVASTQQIRKILNLIGNDVDKKGFIIDLETKKRVLTPEFEEIKIKNLGAVLPGSKIFIRKNIASFSQYLVEHKKK
jgi:hypothetical protein